MEFLDIANVTLRVDISSEQYLNALAALLGESNNFVQLEASAAQVLTKHAETQTGPAAKTSMTDAESQTELKLITVNPYKEVSKKLLKGRRGLLKSDSDLQRSTLSMTSGH